MFPQAAHNLPKHINKYCPDYGLWSSFFIASILFLFLNLNSTLLSAAIDADIIRDRESLDDLQHQAFNYFWESGDPESGLAYEADFGWEVRPLATGGSGLGIAALIVATDRGWVTRNEAVMRLHKITTFLKQISLPEWHGGFPHWLNGHTGETIDFGDGTDVVDTVETALLMQGLLMSRIYFNGPGSEMELRKKITDLWEAVDWNFFTAGQESGIFWHYSPQRGYLGLKIKGYNEALITYVLAAASPSHPINLKTFDFWSQGSNYRTRTVYGYKLQASPQGGGPLFMAHYSFIGLDPHLIADRYVTDGFFIRGVIQTLSNREYCLNYAPPIHRYSENFWGLTSSQIQDNKYAPLSPTNDLGVVAPTAALSSMPYTPHYSMEVLEFLRGRIKEKVWSWFGPKDALSLVDNWVSPHYLAIDQLTIVSMIENYRSGLLWKLFMSDPEIRSGLQCLNLYEPKLKEGFPEAIVSLKKIGQKYIPDAYEIRRHPDQAVYIIPFYVNAAGSVDFSMSIDDESNSPAILKWTVQSQKGRNSLKLPQMPIEKGRLMELTMNGSDGKSHKLPLRLY